MQFTRLRLVGFKSFVEPTEVVIEPGLTGVVGPNGCGKSNLVEALRWVMGENSYKGMRASGMDDVIFAGSGRRPARNTAEVGLVVDNTRRTAPAEFNDADQLEVTRRIERTAGSDYRINGRTVRARDVQILFADASTGSRSPALVRQGQVSELIGAKPAQRRHILEDAAGISGLHSRRHEAELRLRAAEQNLDRVEDVAAEIDKQVEGLRRQARQAKRYRALSAEIRKAEAALHHLKWVAAKGAVADCSAAADAAKAKAADAGTAQAAAARAQAVASHAMPALREAEAEASAALARLRLAAEQLDSEEARAKERIAACERQLADIARDSAREAKLHEDAEAAVAALAAEEGEIARAGAGFAGCRTALETDARAAETALAEAEAASTTAMQAAAAAEAELRARTQAVEQAQRAAERAAAERDRLAAEAARLEGADGARVAAAAAASASVDAEAQSQAAGEAAAAADAALAGARESERAARDAHAAAERRVSELAAEARAIEAFLARPAGDAFPPVIDLVDVAPGYERALAAALGDDLDVPVEAEAAAHWTVVAADGDPALPAAVEPLARHVRAPEALARRLAQIGVVETDEGPALHKALRSGQRLVTRAGDLWRWDGYVAAADAPGTAAQRLAQKNRLDSLCRERAAAEADLARLGAERDAAGAALAETTGADTAARERVRSAQAALVAAHDRQRAAEHKVREIELEAANLGDRLAAAESRHTEAAAALAASEQALHEAPSVEALHAERETAAARLSAARQRAGDLRARLEAELRQNEGRRRRLERIATDRAGWADRLAGAETFRAELAERQAAAERERAALADTPAGIDRRRRSLAGEIAAAEEKARAAGDRRAEAEGVLATADRAAREALEALAAARESAGRAEERLNAANERLATVEAELAEALDCAPWQAADLAGIDRDAPPPELAASEQRLSRLKAERERLGGVNLRADTELDEMEARRGAMLAERDDLVAAIAKLRQGIHGLNREARERLLAAFDIVNGHFERLFTHLFGGGEASLKLVDSDDPLEAGLDIVARPPGKKPQVLSLLSGGEQALTATALIFAAFLTNPAPICVLDEIDAPLDDANVERFCALLDEMTRQTDTRFLVITHNPITMAHMHRLYGVTMAERGVSQLVSVSLEAAEEMRAAS